MTNRSGKRKTEVNYSSGEICEENIEQLKKYFKLDKSVHLNKEKVTNMIIDKYYCYFTPMPQGEKVTFEHEGEDVGNCGSSKVEDILKPIIKGGRKKNIKRITIRKFRKHQYKTKKKNKKSKNKHNKNKK